MLLILLIAKIALLVASVVYIVPLFTRQQVAVRKGSFLTGFLVLLGLGIASVALNLITAGLLAQLNAVSFGILGMLINAGLLMLIGKIKPDAFQVGNFLSAFVAAMAISMSSLVINIGFVLIVRLIA